MIRSSRDRDIVVAALKHAAPYIRMFKRKVFILKAGGELFSSAAATQALVEQIAILHQVGIRVIVVHGSGPQATDPASVSTWTTPAVTMQRYARSCWCHGPRIAGG